MNPNIKGWLREYCQLIDLNKVRGEKDPVTSYEQNLYRMLQPSGIMYGHPAGKLSTSSTGKDIYDPVTQMTLIFTESLIYTGHLRLKEGQSTAKPSGLTEQLIPEISEYFLHLYPDLYRGKVTNYLKDPYYLAENLIGKRISVKTSLIKNYLANLFHNSMLFLDVFYFGEWISGLGSTSISRIRQETEQLKLTILGIMALAAHADRKLQKEERALYEFFLQSANLTKEMENEARSVFSKMKNLSEVEIPHIDSWLLRKYLLEMATLVTIADKEINKLEYDFVDEFGRKLGFTKDETAESLLAVESFVLDNWSAMHYLVGKGTVEKVGSRFVTRLKGFINKNTDYVVQEVRESKQLFYLLGKNRTKNLTKEEQKIVNEQLIDIFKTIPAFVIIALPFTFITLPTLLSLLPNKAFPSSFQE